MADGATEMNIKPTEDISVREVFGIDTDMMVKGFPQKFDRVPVIDRTYKIDPDTTVMKTSDANPSIKFSVV
jgi:cobaltochelatase CobS